MAETKDSEERRNEFVEAAEKLFREHGIVDTTINSIVKEMNVAKGLFYYYFTTKDDMVKAVDRAMTIDDIRLLSKTGGKSGTFARDPQPPAGEGA